MMNEKDTIASDLNDPNSTTNQALGFALTGLIAVALFLVVSLPFIVLIVGGYFLYWASEKREFRIPRLIVTFLILVGCLYVFQFPFFRTVSRFLSPEYPTLHRWFELGVDAIYVAPYELLIPTFAERFIRDVDLLPFLLAAVAIPGAFVIAYLHQNRSKASWVRLFFSRRYYAFFRDLALIITSPFALLIRSAQSKHEVWSVVILGLTVVILEIAYQSLLPHLLVAVQPPLKWPLWSLFHWPLFTLITYRMLREGMTPDLDISRKVEKERDVPWVKVGRDSLGAEVGFTLSELQHHLHVVGQSGSGKSVFLRNLYAHHVRHGLGFAFIDLKADWNTVGELLSLAKKHRRLSDVQILHLSEPELSLPYNVLARGNATELKDKLIGALDWSEIHYKKLAERTLLTLCRGLVVVRDETKQVITLADLHRCLTSSVAIRILAKEVSAQHGTIRQDLHSLAEELSTRAAQEKIEGLRTDLEVMIKSEFGGLLASPESGIDLLDTIENGKILYVLLDSQRFSESSRRLGKLLLSDLKVVSGHLISSGQQAHHFAVIVDEFSELATEDFIGFLNKARGSKIAVTIAHQELSDLARFSSTLRDQIFGCTQTTVAFLQRNPMSAEVLASIAGTRPGKEMTRQTSDGVFFRGYTGTGSEKTVEQFRMHPNEFKNLNVGQAIVISKNPPRNLKIQVNFLDLSKEPVTEEILAGINQVRNGGERMAFDLEKKERFEGRRNHDRSKRENDPQTTLSNWKMNSNDLV